MINLLPPEEKQKLLLKKKEKLTTIWVIIVSVFLICLILILLSIKFYILTKTDYQKNILEQTKQEIQTSDFVSSNAIIQKYNVTLAQLAFYGKGLYFSRVLNIITNVPSPKGLLLTNFSLFRSGGGIVKVTVSGVSDTRDNLLSFKKNIEDNKEIKNPYFSPESWIAPKNVNFSLTFEIHQNEEQ